MSKVELPMPWVQTKTIRGEEADQLEASAGSGLTYQDLEDRDLIISGSGKAPKTANAWAVMAHEWVQLRNDLTGTEVLARLQHAPDSTITITALVFPWNAGRPLTGSNLRDVPVQALSAAFTTHAIEGQSAIMRAMALGDNVPDPRAKLPPADGSARFLALVARQYEALAEDYPHGVPARMAELNSIPASTVRRWLAQARKEHYLAPSRQPFLSRADLHG